MIDAVAVIAAIGSLLAGITAAGLAKKWVWGWTYEEIRRERDFWRDTALKAMGHADKAIDTVRKVSGG